MVGQGGVNNYRKIQGQMVQSPVYGPSAEQKKINQMGSQPLLRGKVLDDNDDDDDEDDDMEFGDDMDEQSPVSQVARQKAGAQKMDMTTQ